MKKRDQKTKAGRAPAAGSLHDQPTQILRRAPKPVDDATVRDSQTSAWAQRQRKAQIAEDAPPPQAPPPSARVAEGPPPDAPPPPRKRGA
jgi:hypothetical protein